MSDNQGMSSGVNNSIAEYLETMSLNTEDTLHSIDLTLKAIAKKDGLIISQSSLKDLAAAEQQAQVRTRNVNQNTNKRPDAFEQRRNSGNLKRGIDEDEPKRKKRKNVFDQFSDSFDKSLKAEFDKSNPVNSMLKSSMDNLAKRLNVSTDQLGSEIGNRLGKISATAFKNSRFGQTMTAEFNWIANRVSRGVGGFADRLGDFLDRPELFGNPQQRTSEENSEIGFNETDEYYRVLNETMTTGNERVSNDITNLSQTVVSQFEELYSVMREGDQNVIDELVTGNDAQVSANELAEASANSNLERVNDIADIVDSRNLPVGKVVESGSEVLDMAQNAEGVYELAQGAQQAGTAIQAVTNAGTALGPILGGVGAAAGPLAMAFPFLTIAIGLAGLAIDKFSEQFKELGESFSNFKAAAKEAANRTASANAKNLEEWKKRTKADAEALVEASYSVIKDSAEMVQKTWDSILQNVAATQGYDKAGVQELWSSYADRLSREGLASVISSADIMDKLSEVLKSGMSGLAAEEFAYQATLLNNAVPSEDFFQYASTYASIAANAMKAGADESEALSIANEELTSFASNVLYASRQIAGGLTTSLSNASDLFEKSAKIAYTSRVGDISDISGVLTSASAIIGATAPDLVGNIIDAIVNAATGGNSSELTALRSMAGTGASNTAFLNALAKNPQKVFSDLFRNLSQIQNMSAENYMELSEGLSQVFGMGIDAFARVDFAYLADAISAMDINNASLEQNMSLLASGQTTSTESQLRMQKINEYMVEQGLAYVLDNEVARSIQEHMWQEQIAREIEQTTFSVELQGAAMELFQSIFNTIQKIVDVLNPFSWIKKLGNVELTALESASREADIKDILERGKVGQGTKRELYNLTTGKEDLKLTTSYVELLGGTSKLKSALDRITTYNAVVNPFATFGGNSQLQTSTHRQTTIDMLVEAAGKLTGTISKNTAANKEVTAATKSYYSARNLVSKSAASTLSSGDWRESSYDATWSNEEDKGERTQEEAKSLQQRLQNSIKDFVKDKTAESEKFNKSNATSLFDAVKGSLVGTIDNGVLSGPETVDVNEKTGVVSVLHRSFKTQDELLKAVQKEQAEAMALQEKEGTTFDQWIKQFTGERDSLKASKKLEEQLADYGTDLETIRAAFESEESSQSSAAAKARDLHEEQFWEDMQQFATKDFPWYLREWQRYYIQHEAYSNATKDAYESAKNLSNIEKGEEKDAVLALAKHLTGNDMWNNLTDAIKDPTVQTNALLAKILLVVEAIMHQNNETSIVSVPTSLSALGLAITNT